MSDAHQDAFDDVIEWITELPESAFRSACKVRDARAKWIRPVTGLRSPGRKAECVDVILTLMLMLGCLFALGGGVMAVVALQSPWDRMWITEIDQVEERIAALRSLDCIRGHDGIWWRIRWSGLAQPTFEWCRFEARP